MESTSNTNEEDEILQNAQKYIRELDSKYLETVFDILVPAERHFPPTFWQKYSVEDKHTGLRACLLMWVTTKKEVLPRDFQIEATIAIMTGRDCLIDVGTGYGKTLCMALSCLLAPKELAVIFSPLKRLQAVQVLQFMQYGIKSIAINEETPNSPDLWKVSIFLG